MSERPVRVGQNLPTLRNGASQARPSGPVDLSRMSVGQLPVDDFDRDTSDRTTIVLGGGVLLVIIAGLVVVSLVVGRL